MDSLFEVVVVARVLASGEGVLQGEGVQEGVIYEARSSVVRLEKMVDFDISQLLDWIDHLVL
jgi:hypothetical protein